jgi:hypothetical protein
MLTELRIPFRPGRFKKFSQVPPEIAFGKAGASPSKIGAAFSLISKSLGVALLGQSHHNYYRQKTSRDRRERFPNFHPHLWRSVAAISVHNPFISIFSLILKPLLSSAGLPLKTNLLCMKRGFFANWAIHDDYPDNYRPDDAARRR